LQADHERHMRQAIALTANVPELPFASVIVHRESGETVAEGWNKSKINSTWHGEIDALNALFRSHQPSDASELVLYTTAEPCPMCMGAALQARVSRLVFGAYDPKWGAAGSLYNLASDGRLNHRIELIPGIMEEECAALVQRFFQSRRGQKW